MIYSLNIHTHTGYVCLTCVLLVFVCMFGKRKTRKWQIREKIVCVVLDNRLYTVVVVVVVVTYVCKCGCFYCIKIVRTRRDCACPYFFFFCIFIYIIMIMFYFCYIYTVHVYVQRIHISLCIAWRVPKRSSSNINLQEKMYVWHIHGAGFYNTPHL